MHSLSHTIVIRGLRRKHCSRVSRNHKKALLCGNILSVELWLRLCLYPIFTRDTCFSASLYVFALQITSIDGNIYCELRKIIDLLQSIAAIIYFSLPLSLLLWLIQSFIYQILLFIANESMLQLIRILWNQYTCQSPIINKISNRI